MTLLDICEDAAENIDNCSGMSEHFVTFVLRCEKVRFQAQSELKCLGAFIEELKDYFSPESPAFPLNLGCKLKADKLEHLWSVGT